MSEKDIPIGEFYVTKKGKKYECVEALRESCSGCAFDTFSKQKHCDAVYCTRIRKDQTPVIFIRRKDLEETK